MNKEYILNQGLTYLFKFNDMDKAIESFTDAISILIFS
jgi:hypothetical protein